MCEKGEVIYPKTMNLPAGRQVGHHIGEAGNNQQAYKDNRNDYYESNLDTSNYSNSL